MNQTYTPKIEWADAEQIAEFQNVKLRETLDYLNQRSPYYQALFAQHGIDVGSIRTTEELCRIPITTKRELQERNADFLCIDRHKIVDYTTTSGTLGDPVTFALSDADLDRLAYNEALSFATAGCGSGTVFQLMTTIDKRFMAGMAYFLGARRLGAGIVRVGNGVPELQWDTIRRIEPDTIICVPSFILKVIAYAKAHGIDYRNCSVKKAICIGESLREDDFSLNLLGQKIKQEWDLELYTTYASTEMSTTFAECSAGQGGHLHPELIIAQIVDQNGNELPDGHYGELVVTTLGVEAMPLLRFNTGDVACFRSEKCSCGRTTKRIGPIVGRRNQMIKLKGTTLYPASVFDVVDHKTEVSAYYVEVSDSEYGTDELTVYIAVEEDEQRVKDELREHFRSRLRVTPTVVVRELNEILAVHNTQTNRKPTKFIDSRTTTYERI